MKRNIIVFPIALLVLGFALAQLTGASAEEKGATPDAQEKPAPETPSAADIDAKLSEAIRAVYPDATISGSKKVRTVGTNDVYAVQFASKGGKMGADVTGYGILLESEEPGDIKKFPQAANDALRKAITSMGTRDNGIRLRRTYAEFQKDEAGEFTVVKLSEPLVTYWADVQNNHGESGRYGFKADGSVLVRPSWAK